MESLLDAVLAISLVGWLVIVGVVLLIWVGYTIGSRIMGFGPHVVKLTETFEYKNGNPVKKSETHERQTSRTFWDWMTVLTISAALAFVSLMFTSRQAAQQQQIQDEQVKDTALQAYLDQMTQMMLDDKNPLSESKRGDEERTVARVQTVTALKRLDGEHNKIVMTFLRESGLINFRLPGSDQEDSVVRLDTTDLNRVDLANTSFSGINLRFAELRYANLDDAKLGVANLTFADLAHATLKGADLRDAVLLFANLEGADLGGANFAGARLRGVDLSGANLETAKNLTQYQINQAGAGDSETKLPEGRNAPDWWSKPNADPPRPYHRLREPELGASLVDLKFVKADLSHDIGIPKTVGTSPKYGTAGALVYDVEPDAPAHAVGLRPGDIIIEKNGGRVDLKDLEKELDQYQAGDPFQFTILRLYFQKGWRKAHVPS
jgi:uncharacterized protein YjbI with pentapeptide repeats